MDYTREHIYLAALLHDIGKFYQRADTGSTTNSKYLNEVNKVESTFLPLNHNGYYTHKHCLWTAQFIDDNASIFKSLIGANSSNLMDKNNLINLAAGHHLPKEQLSDLGRIVKEADCLSSGMDRESIDALKDDQDESKWDSFKTKRMTSILETIGMSTIDANNKNNWQHLPIVPISLSKDFFPKKNFSEAPDYSKLWNDFIGEFKFIQANTYLAFNETLLNLLFKYSCCIPSSTINFPDVSLFDHLKTTAALSVCLYDYYKSGSKAESKFLLIGGDFSGIQSFIYQIISKYAGKNLKGRSFYLHILSDVIVRFLLKELNLYQANIIYNSGGSFYILAPNTEFVRTQLEKATIFIEKQLYKHHSLSLFVAIDSVELGEKDLKHEDGRSLSKVWALLFNKRDEKKNHKFAKLIQENYSDFFQPIMRGGETKRDVITGEEFMPDEKPFISKETKEFNNENPIKHLTGMQILLGKYLRDTDFMVVSEEEILYWKDKKSISPLDMGFYYYFLTENEVAIKQEQLRASADKVSVIRFNGKNGNCDFIGSTAVQGINNIYGLKFYGGNEFNGQTFEELCNPIDKESALSRLGVLRMDVDNLGSLFQSGIPSDRATLSRYSALSRSFDYFFSGYINTLQNKIARDSTFIIYSGGDDLFIVGKWSDTIILAKQINLDFKEFTCSNDIFSISGGIAIVTPTFPLMKAAEESSIEEHNAKDHSVNNHSKNSISFMDTPLNWSLEFPAVEALKDSFIELSNKDSIPKSLLSKIMAHATNADFNNHRISNKNLRVFWLLVYDLNRMKERLKAPEAKQFIDLCIKEVCSNSRTQLNGKFINTNYHPLELWAFAARWAELEMRTDNIH